jgi:predicted RecA/RadA family phage recombinase
LIESSVAYIDIDGDAHGVFWIPTPVAEDIEVGEDLAWIWCSHGVMKSEEGKAQKTRSSGGDEKRRSDRRGKVGGGRDEVGEMR